MEMFQNISSNYKKEDLVTRNNASDELESGETPKKSVAATEAINFKIDKEYFLDFLSRNGLSVEISDCGKADISTEMYNMLLSEKDSERNIRRRSPMSDVVVDNRVRLANGINQKHEQNEEVSRATPLLEWAVEEFDFASEVLKITEAILDAKFSTREGLYQFSEKNVTELLNSFLNELRHSSHSQKCKAPHSHRVEMIRRNAAIISNLIAAKRKSVFSWFVHEQIRCFMRHIHMKNDDEEGASSTADNVVTNTPLIQNLCYVSKKEHKRSVRSYRKAYIFKKNTPACQG